MLKIIGDLYAHFSKKRKMQLFLLAVVTLLGAFFEVLAVGSIVPFLSVLSNPDLIFNHHYLHGFFVDVGFVQSSDLLLPVVLCFVFIAICSALARLALIKVNTAIAYGIGSDLQIYVYNKILSKPFSFHANANSSEMIASISKAGSVASVLYALIQFSSAAVIIVFVLSGLLILDAKTAIVAGSLFLATYFVISYSIRRLLVRNSEVIANLEGQRIRCVQEGLGGVRDIILDNSRPVFVSRFAEMDINLKNARASNTVCFNAPRYVVEGVAMVLVATFAFIGVLGGISLIDSLPVLGALALGAQKLIPLFQQVYQGWSQFNGNRNVFIDVLQLVGKPDFGNSDHLAVKKKNLSFEASIELRNVTFFYAEETSPALNDVTFEIKRGEKVGIIGKTGSGKSTLADILMGLLLPVTGEIKIDGQKLNTEIMRDWHAKIAHVPQAIYLSDSSIAENIAFGFFGSDIDMVRVEKAARDAQLHSFVESLDLGYQTPVGERGVRLSGGQRQRIGIARALYKGAEVLFLDEATSALDNETEAAVMQSIQQLSSDITVIIIAHRLSTLKCCDRIVKLDKGFMIDQGPYQDVIGDAN